MFHQLLAQKVVKEGDAYFVNGWPTFESEEIENVNEKVDGQEAGEQRHVPFESEILGFHVHTAQKTKKFWAEFLYRLFKSKVHHRQLRQPINKKRFHLEILILEKMHKDEESQVFLVISDMQQNRYYKVHPLAIAHTRKEKSNCTKHSFQFKLSLFGFGPLSCIGPGQITFDLLERFLVHVRLCTFRQNDLVKDYIDQIVVNHLAIVLLVSIFVDDFQLLLHIWNLLCKNVAFLHQHLEPLLLRQEENAHVGIEDLSQFLVEQIQFEKHIFRAKENLIIRLTKSIVDNLTNHQALPLKLLLCPLFKLTFSMR